MIKIIIPLAPISKKNSQRILVNNKTRKPFIMPSEQYKQYEYNAALFVPKGIHIDEPVNIKCLFYMPTRRKCDLTNLLEAIDDVLVKAGLLADDNFTVVESHDGSRVLYDKENPRTEIYISDPISVMYMCDKKKCKNCTFPMCKHTTDKDHAINFRKHFSVYIEKDEREETATDKKPQGLHKYETRGQK